MSKKKRAANPVYVSPQQLGLAGFESPFSQHLEPTNRWVILSQRIPWDQLVSIYNKQMKTGTGRPGLNARIVLGSMIIKHICDLSDRDTIEHIVENIYMQYFLGYDSFRREAPFDASLFVEIRERLGMEGVQAMNESIVQAASILSDPKTESEENSSTKEDPPPPPVTHKGRVLFDATACPQDIAYPTDLGLLNDAREKSEQLIDLLYDADKHGIKPRTHRNNARKAYLVVAKKKRRTKNEIRKAIGKQLRFLKRNLRHIDRLLVSYPGGIPLEKKEYKYLLVLHTFYEQQLFMYQERTHSVADRIVSIHQPHVRPMVRGKARTDTEFGAKINVSLINGYAFLDELSWDAFNEGGHLKRYVEAYRQRFGYYPCEVLADQIYCNRENRNYLKGIGVKLLSKPLGRPPAVKVKHVSPGERNPIEGKFGQAKNAYGLDKIRARLKQTSQTWIAMILLVVNLVKLARTIPHALLGMFIRFSAHLNYLLYSTQNKIGVRNFPTPIFNDF